MSDCYESMSRTTIRDRPLEQPLIGESRHPFVIPAPQSSFRRRPESRGVGRGKPTRRWKKPTRRPTIFILLCGLRKAMVIPAKAGIQGEESVPRVFIPWCAGTSRHGRLVGKHVPDSDPGSIPPPACDTNPLRPNNDSRGSKERCTAGAYPQPMARRAACLGCTDRHPANFIFPMRPSQGHGDSREGLESTNFIHADKRQTRINALPLLGYASRE